MEVTRCWPEASSRHASSVRKSLTYWVKVRCIELLNKRQNTLGVRPTRSAHSRWVSWSRNRRST